MAKNDEISLISADLFVSGDVIGENALHIEGRVEGNIRTRSVSIGVNGIVVGSIQADYLEIHGSVSGQINARSVKLTNTARVEGDITHEVLSIEPGAVLEGRCHRQDDPINAKEGEKDKMLTDKTEESLALKD
ncbi:MAG: polymer-forming cytoskeletal protein [Alphaproteobacteria bacterium]|nr:polymer-forming cytoskeletal protein [Alphaproteobacteria bacterium]